MRTLKVMGLLVLAVWMAWITVRVEMTLRVADDACRQLNPERENPDRCESGIFYPGLVDRIYVPDRNPN